MPVLVGVSASASQRPNTSWGKKDRHKAPTSTPLHPPVPTGGRAGSFGRQISSDRERHYERCPDSVVKARQG